MPLIATDRIDRMPAPKRRQRGLTLVELTVTLLILTVLATIAIRSTNDLGFQVRYEQTKERLEMIRNAILGNPRLIINGQQAISGFVADMGRLPVNIRELIQRKGDCDVDAGDVSETECLGLSGTWNPDAWNSNPVTRIHSTGLRYGWNGPYLNISGNPADEYAFTDGWGREAKGYCETSIDTDQGACDVSDWIGVANDHNYGWYFNQLPLEEKTLTILSYGKDQISGDGDDYYDADYPSPASQPVVRGNDWLVNISGGISVSFLKPGVEYLSMFSRCSDPQKTSRDECEEPNLWYGGCDIAGFYNKSSCEAHTTGSWSNCSDDTDKNKEDCHSAGFTYYGQGYGCSDQFKTTKTDCESPAVWRNCSDDGTIDNESDCLSANEVWFGDLIFAPKSKSICMKIYYRNLNSLIGTLVSDAKTISAESGLKTIRFTHFRDEDDEDTEIVDKIPLGTIAIGIYKHNGSVCTNDLYPVGRQPVAVNLYSKAHLPVINW
ncbi:type II secretion system protein [Methylotuvimicrobium alcaliphilum]|uniref:Uncharacterized protein n=1 Tax=Methylotuvimicrobium alcaliphilum (strain DSM 19304 / NCIMB 14124 / VKM B-2133 / 20Z) TaxID=1091494 RepID=G4SYI5_META2|nr:type II secretion system protein [Methylotuvimicrobium alcaliphilum]CCE22179.1 protein of unknown function [Methylotuvimicrobium alcaliphilum 20Z]